MLHALDFETEAIDNRPHYPPKPVGLAHFDGTDSIYLAWGHPCQNNCTEANAIEYLLNLFESEIDEFIYHNTAFDCSIIEERWHIEVPWGRVHDTMLQAFLLDPYGELSLKPLADKYLGMAPVEQDAVRDWLIHHGVVRANSKDWGAFIAKAPGDLVGRYAIGDVVRTYHLFHFFHQRLAGKGMQ